LTSLIGDKRLLDLLPVAVVVCDSSGIPRYANRPAAELWGREPGSVPGTPCPAPGTEMGTLLAEVLRTGQPQRNCGVRLERPDGSRVRLLVNLDPLRDDTGAVIGAVFSADGAGRTADTVPSAVAERRRTARLAVTEVLAQSASLTEAAAPILRAIGTSLEWHAGALWGVDPAAQVLRCLEFWHRPSAPVARFEAESRQRHFERGIGLPGRVWAQGQAAWIPDLTRDGNFLRAAVADHEGLHGAVGFPIRVCDEVLGVVEFFSAEVREPDADLLEMMTTIGGQIGQFMERKRAEEAQRDSARLQDAFLAALAHELRNPLAPLRNAVQILRAAADSPGILEETRVMMERQIRHMVRLIDDLLEISRITRGTIDLHKERRSLYEIVAAALKISGPVVEASGNELTVTLTPVPLYLDADPARLAQALANLLDNAARFTERGGQIGLTVEREGETAVIRVRDTGIGIPPEMLRRIFDLFVQVRGDASHAPGGLGIGLTLVKNLVELHGGSVEAYSEGPGQGSVFTVRLPIGARAPDGSAVAESLPGLPAAAANALRILIVDDNVDAGQTLGTLLRLMGHEVRVVHDGPAALREAASFQPDLAILDLGMPGMSGFELARQLRQRPQLQGMVLAALTGWSQEEDRRQSREAGFDHHLVKPLAPERLQELLALLPRRAL
jgi:signal transduction histidine kinase